MSTRNFILRCKRTINDCTRLLQTDDGHAVLQSTIVRLETMERSLEWSRGRIINAPTADLLLQDLREYIVEVRRSWPTTTAQQVHSGYHAPLILLGGRVPSQYSISREQLSFLRSCGFTATKMAQILKVSLRTVTRRLRRFHMLRSGIYSTISDAALDDLIKELLAGNNQIGPESVRAQLQAQQLWIQRRRVRDSMRRIDPEAAALRAMSQRLHRRAYRVAGPNSLRHLDGNHKLIRWRIVIHGGIDGYSRLVVFLRASDNNRCTTVMASFMDAVAKYGVPSRVRTDHGGENNSVCLMMNIFRGSHRGSALRGRSTHNQRIERLWGDLWRGCLERQGQTTSAMQSLFGGGQGDAQEEPESEGRADAGDVAQEEPEREGGADAGDVALDWPERVTVPRNQHLLSDEDMEQLTAQFDPLAGRRGDLGLDVIQNILSFMATLNVV
ncbi:hypothetical protein JOQ06_029396 [Pogonophryne albipinna]|uniref:Integrase core domain-containing protein n=1 Tax=Pogonophryne albipinna TaxID=1090488 RepID=A0AAD6FMM6_9TELE|nr:hypothetical protein JOQ06_029396 [Pogonophryne albipinna]